MTVAEYLKRKGELKGLSPAEIKFLRDICTSVGHNLFKDLNAFADVCTRCGNKKSWYDIAS